MVGGLLLALVIVAVVLIVARPHQKRVPAVIGRDLIAAQATLDAEGFEVGVKRVANVAAKGRVLGQDPDAGAEADDGSTVTLTVSGGPGQGTVPDVAQLSEPRAQAALRDAGFRPKVRQQFSAAVAQGVAIRTQPSPGARLQRLSPVVLVVSKGPQTVGVPDVTGEAEQAAKTALRRAGLRYEVIEERSKQSPGNVVGQAPGPGALVLLDSVVRVIVDKAPQTVRVPQVKGDSAGNAASAVSALGLGVFFRSKVVTDRAQAGIVLSQAPAAGARVDLGTLVVLQTGKYQPKPPPPTPPPPTQTTTTAPTTTAP